MSVVRIGGFWGKDGQKWAESEDGDDAVMISFFLIYSMAQFMPQDFLFGCLFHFFILFKWALHSRED